MDSRAVVREDDYATSAADLQPRLSDALRIGVLGGWALWGAAYAVWGEVVSPQLVSLGGVQLYLTDILLGGTIALGVPDLLSLLLDRERSGRERLAATIVGLYVLYTLGVVMPKALMLGLPLTTLLRLAAGRFVLLIVPMVLGLASRRPSAVPLLLALPGVAVIMPAIAGFVRTMLGAGFTYQEGGEVRFRVLWGGAVLFFGWPVFVSASRRAKGTWWQALGILGILGLLVTNHRSGYIAFLATLPIVLRPSNRTMRRTIVAVGIAAGLVLFALAVASIAPANAYSYSFTRLLDYTSGTGADRLVRWQTALQVFVTNPLNDVLWAQNSLQSGAVPSVAYVAHNWVLEVAVSEGLVGLFVYVSLLLTTTAEAIRRMRGDPVVAGLVGYVAFFVVFCLFNTNFYSIACSPLLWMACGILLHLTSRPGASLDVERMAA